MEKSAFEVAAEQFQAAARLRTIRAAPRQRLNHAITIVDSMLAFLEQSNLTGTRPPQQSLESGISALRRVVPDKCAIPATAVRSPERLMDELFAIQQSLLKMRAGPAWAGAYRDEERASVDREALQERA